MTDESVGNVFDIKTGKPFEAVAVKDPTASIFLQDFLKSVADLENPSFFIVFMQENGVFFYHEYIQAWHKDRMAVAVASAGNALVSDAASFLDEEEETEEAGGHDDD
jgi:hypothetical protein